MLAYDWNFLGLSTETKPMTGEKVVDGSTFYECDTSTFFIYYQGEWYQQTFFTEDGINFWLYKTLMKKMFGKLFDSNISKGKIIKPTTGTEIEFTTSQIAQITDLTGYGDTYQQTYSGKNLFSGNFAQFDSTGGTGTTYSYFELPSEDNYVLTLIAKNDIPIQSSSKYLGFTKQGGSASGGYKWVFNADSTATKGQHFTVTNTYQASYLNYLSIYHADATTLQWFTENFDIQLEKGSTATAYEPYVGGTASPNPDYPQDVQVVTGEQTVTINGEQIYPIDLGSIELCKIGTYQDYIYKSGDDWYVHKETEKLVADGSESGWNSSAVSGGRQFFIPIQGISSVSPRIIACDNFYYIIGSTAENTTYINSSSLWVIYKPTSNGSPIATSTAEFKTWLSTHNTTLYYALATPTDTKITDNTLISNLNSLLNYIFPVGDHQIVITADDLPMALKLIITEKE